MQVANARRQMVDNLLQAILACEDADMVMTSMLLARRGDPPEVVFEFAASDAKLWAAASSPAELVVYAEAVIAELEDRGFSAEIRARLAQSLWSKVPANIRDHLRSGCRNAGA